MYANLFFLKYYIVYASVLLSKFRIIVIPVNSWQPEELVYSDLALIPE